MADLFGIPSAEVPDLIYADPTRAPGGPNPDVETIVALTRGMATVARFLWPIPDRGLARRLYRVVAPALIVHGAQDHFVPPRYADEFARLLPNASVQLIDGAGHMLTVEAVQDSVSAMERFLLSVEAPA